MSIIINISARNQSTIQRLVDIWEASVRATHHFLSEQDIQAIKPLVKHGLQEIPHLFIAQDNTNPSGFIGVADNKIEMLFIHPDARGQGIGKMLVQYALIHLKSTFVDVNEQNPQAIGFYEKLGFKTFERSPLDDQGRPFPILHMKLEDHITSI
jgi:putative acetyltransferase